MLLPARNRRSTTPLNVVLPPLPFCYFNDRVALHLTNVVLLLCYTFKTGSQSELFCWKSATSLLPLADLNSKYATSVLRLLKPNIYKCTAFYRHDRRSTTFLLRLLIFHGHLLSQFGT